MAIDQLFDEIDSFAVTKRTKKTECLINIFTRKMFTSWLLKDFNHTKLVFGKFLTMPRSTFAHKGIYHTTWDRTKMLWGITDTELKFCITVNAIALILEKQVGQARVEKRIEFGKIHRICINANSHNLSSIQSRRHYLRGGVAAVFVVEDDGFAVARRFREPG